MDLKVDEIAPPILALYAGTLNIVTMVAHHSIVRGNGPFIYNGAIILSLHFFNFTYIMYGERAVCSWFGMFIKGSSKFSIILSAKSLVVFVFILKK